MADNPLRGIIKALYEVPHLDPALVRFQAESNKIDGVNSVTHNEVEALGAFLTLHEISVENLHTYVSTCEPSATLRYDDRGMRLLLKGINTRALSSYEALLRIEHLRPFSDCNGRCGRAVWFWMHRGIAPSGFLQTFYQEAISFYAAKQR